MTNARSDKERWDALLDALSDDISEMPDEMILREFSADAEKEARRVRGVIANVLGDTDQTPYEAAEEALEEHRGQAGEVSLPETPQGRRELLARIMGGGHLWSQDVTLAFRDITELSDGDVQGILEDLAALYDGDDENL